jgi:3-dehydroquinate synthase
LKRITVAPSNAADDVYDVVVGSGVLETLPELLREAVAAPRFALICDSNVAPLWGGSVRNSVNASGARVDLLVFDAGEASKNRETWAVLSDALLERGVGRDACVLALGGGVCCDLAGFVAATFMRGIACIQIPTSLLAMIDASIGGKTGINVPQGKNLIGAFLSPRMVIVDPAVLETLPDEELRAGLSEAVKHGAISDESYFDWIAENAEQILKRDAAALERLVVRSIEIKTAVVAADPRESGMRATLNFGHTLGHGIEKVLGYRMAHGHAVAIGMALEAALGEALGITSSGTAARIRTVLETLGLPHDLPPEVDPAALIAATSTDKKSRASRVRYALLERPGTIARTSTGSWTHEVTPESVLHLLPHASA